MMHASISKPVVVTNVKTSGYAGNLTKGQLAFVQERGALKGKGAKVVDDLALLSLKDRVSIRVGEVTTPSKLRIPEVKYKETGFVPLNSIIDITGYVPSNSELELDHIEIGYDGITVGSGIYIPEGKATVVDITVYGEVASMLFGSKEFTFTHQVFRAEGETMQSVIRRVVKELKELNVPTAGGFASTSDKLGDFLNIGVIDSTNTALTGTDKRFYSVEVVDEGDSNALALVQAQYDDLIIVRKDYKNGKSTYETLASNLEEEVVVAPLSIKTVETLNEKCDECPEGYTLSNETCYKETIVNYEWVEGEVCKTSTKVFEIILPDTDCGADLTSELSAYYPNTIIAKTAEEGGCKTKYTATVVTDIVRPECDAIYLQEFIAEEPSNFNGHAWVEQAVTFSDTAEMGIFIKGKPYIVSPKNIEEDFIPYIETSLKVKSATFGADTNLYLNYDYEVSNPEVQMASVRRIKFASDRKNTSNFLFGAERMGDLFFTNKTVFKKNLYARTNLSQERLLKYDTKYVQFDIKIRDNSLSQGGAGRSDITTIFKIIVEYGRHLEVQTYLNTFAVKLNLPTLDIK